MVRVVLAAFRSPRPKPSRSPLPYTAFWINEPSETNTGKHCGATTLQAWRASRPPCFLAGRRDSCVNGSEYFGLLPSAIGKGFGTSLLSDAIIEARSFGCGRVWVHTCSLDHPAALPNYLGRGFAVREVTETIEEIPEQPLQPWQGANLRPRD